MTVMPMPREKWTDERLDDLNKKVDETKAEMREGFARVDGEIKGLRREMDARFDKVDARFDKVDARFDKVDARFDRWETRMENMEARMQHLLIGGFMAVVAAIVGSNTL